jgi:hypothetical protein
MENKITSSYNGLTTFANAVEENEVQILMQKMDQE